MRLLLAAAAALVALPAQAQTELLSFSGSTQPIGADYVEPIYGKARVYDVVAFSVDTAGDYIVRTAASTDAQLVLYAGSFDPGTPGANLRAYEDDCEGSTAVSKFPCAEDNEFRVFGAEPLTLSPGVTYFAVTSYSGFYGSDSVPTTYSGTVSGPAGATVSLEEAGGGTDIGLSVSSLATVIPTTGGKARFGVTVSNGTENRLEGDVVVSVNGVERRRLSSALTAGGSQSFTVNLSFPARVPDGVYTVSLMAVADTGEMSELVVEDVTVGGPVRQAHPNAIIAQLKAAEDAKGLEAFAAERRAAAEMVGVSTGGARVGSIVRKHQAATE
jgi:hypothetical protein